MLANWRLWCFGGSPDVVNLDEGITILCSSEKPGYDHVLVARDRWVMKIWVTVTGLGKSVGSGFAARGRFLYVLLFIRAPGCGRFNFCCGRFAARGGFRRRYAVEWF